MAAFRRLVGTADAVVNNLRGDQPAKLGLDYASLKGINPRVVCLHISAYGRDNERAGWPGYDYLMQAEAGLMSLTGEPENPPTRFGMSATLPLIGREDLGRDPRFRTGVLRGQNRAALTEELDRAFSQKTTDEWIALLTGVVPVGPVYDVARALANPFVETVGMVRTVPHPLKPDLKMLANPLKVDGRRPQQTVCSPLGADNDEVLGKAAPAPALSK